MIDETIWQQLSEDEKLTQLQLRLDELISIEQGRHEHSKTASQGRLPAIRLALQEDIFKIIELENAT